MPVSIDISRAQIERVVKTFYARVRAHSGLGPIFAKHVQDWPAHEDKIVRFWASALLQERSYDGNPMRAHKLAGNVRPEHFICWLQLFDEVLNESLPREIAEKWSALAHRIGRGLSMGLQDFNRPQGSVPDLGVKHG